jgi:phosphoserine aminotransferase
MKKKGIENIRKEQEEKIRLLYTFFDAHKQYKPFITNTKDRSKTVVVITVGKTLKKLQQKLHKKGFIVGEGYGAYKDTQIRIACFPTHTLDDIKSLLEVLKNE